MTDKDDALLGNDDAAAIGFKVVEMADRVKVGQKFIPGAKAKWRFEMDGVNYDVTVSIATD